MTHTCKLAQKSGQKSVVRRQHPPFDEANSGKLGFGCSALMGRLGARQSRRLIDAAIDAGITHFDTARMYGYGDAEKALAGIVAADRSRITIATKAGILPPRRSLLRTAAMQTARSMVALHPGLREVLRRRALGTMAEGKFDVPSLTRSIHTSLHELGTDYVDILLLHECSTHDLAQPALFALLAELIEKGTARQVGIATSWSRTLGCLPLLPDRDYIVQIPSNPINRHTCDGRLSGFPLISHSALGDDFTRFLARACADAASTKRWSDSLGFDVADHRYMGRVFLRAALNANTAGIVLFSSTSEKTIVANAGVLEDRAVAESANRLAAVIAGNQLR